MGLKDDLLEIEKGFWLAGVDFFRDHVTEQVMLVFPQMKGIYSREEVAASAADPKRWQDLRIADLLFLQPNDTSALLSYEARAKRGSGEAYRALASSAYVREGDGWKLAFHQHSQLEPEAAA